MTDITPAAPGPVDQTALLEHVRSLRNREYRVIRPSGETVEDIRSPGRLHEILVGEFDLAVTAGEAERLFADAAATLPASP